MGATPLAIGIPFMKTSTVTTSLLLLLPALLSTASCADDAEPAKPGVGGAGGSGGSGGTGAQSSGGSGGTTSNSLCSVEFRYKPDAGTTLSSVEVAGEWNGFDKSQTLKLTGPDADGYYNGSRELKPGFWGYKLVLNGSDWILDPGQGYRKYVDGTENSGLRVKDCGFPRLEAVTTGVSRPSAGAGALSAKVRALRAVTNAALDAKSVSAKLLHHGSEDDVAKSVSLANDELSISLSALADGKYTLLLGIADADGLASEPLRLVFWVEAEKFQWSDALIYMVMTDRFKNGDSKNDAPKTAGVQDSRGDFQGGDLQGVTQKIADGTLDQLGVRALWLTPFQTNPAGAYLASDNFHMVTGYHGYWPIRAREVDARIGGAEALHALVKEAHAHGIRILMDYVVNHVHQDHEYYKQHPEWFRTGCVCGTSGCDWTEKRLECLFTPYLPDVNWTVPAVGEQLVEDALYWLEEFDLDGLRVDAVKHVEDIAIRNLSTRIADELEVGGTPYFLMGETAMGWSDCGLDCNKSQYGTISQYIGPYALDGQFDFVLYHGVPYRVFAYDEKGFLHADYWTQQSQAQYPAGSVMTPFIGSHDSPRFVTLASYRGQPGYDKGVPGNQWNDVAGAPPDAEPYARHALALSWLFGLPGAPLLYYGDEYAEWGGSDPGNRALWRGDGTLSANESAVLDRTRKLGSARRELVALRRGTYRSLYATETFLAFARETQDGKVAIVALSRDPGPTTTDITLPVTLPVANGTALKDRLGGPSITPNAGKISISLPGRGAALYAP